MSNTGAILQVLAFLGTAALLGLGTLIAIWGFSTGRAPIGRLLAIGCVAVAAVYLAALILFSVLSRRTLLPVAAEKYFCELDCHLAYSVTEVRSLNGAGQGDDTLVVLVQTRFDEKTISASRSRTAPTWPAPRVVALVDAEGMRYQPLDNADSLVKRLRLSSTPISRELAPGESYVTVFAFEVPKGTLEPTLLVTDDLVVTRFLIGNERSFLHAPLLLALPAPIVVPG